MAERRDVTDPTDRFWTIDQAAAHLDVKRATITKYIREGLALHFTQKGSNLLARDELLAEVRARAERRRASLGKKTSA